VSAVRRTRWGWHQLADGRARRLVLAAEINPGDLVLDVGKPQVDAADLRLPRRPFKVVANPPFAITTALIRRLLCRGSRLVSADLVVPRHVVARWSNGRGPGVNRWGQLFDAYTGSALPGAALCPPPPGPVAVLRLERRHT
jgi:23S rRNA (adenine-N6)-dimethyltransferase